MDVEATVLAWGGVGAGEPAAPGGAAAHTVAWIETCDSQAICHDALDSRWEWSGGAPSVSCGHEHARAAVLRTVPSVVRAVGARRLPDGVGRLDAWWVGAVRACVGVFTGPWGGAGASHCSSAWIRGVVGAEVLPLKGSVRMVVGDEIRMVVGGIITEGACSHSGARVFGPLARHVEVSRLRDVGEYAPGAGVGHPELSDGVLKESRGVPACVLVTEAQLIERADAVLVVVVFEVPFFAGEPAIAPVRCCAAGLSAGFGGVWRLHSTPGSRCSSGAHGARRTASHCGAARWRRGARRAMGRLP